MQTKALIIAIIENENGDVLMRKKPDGSPPYTQTWYLFGADFVPGGDVSELLRAHVRKQTGIDCEILKRLGWDDEVKHDLDGIEKQFIYLDTLCRYVSGELTPSEGIEKLEWVSRAKLADYDLVPPSRKLFKQIGYIAT